VIPQEARTGFEPVIRVLQTTGKSAANPYFISILPPLLPVWYTIGTLSVQNPFLLSEVPSGIPLLSPPIDQPLLYIFSTFLPVTAYTDIQF
jgi:hypothetical protein